MKGCLKYLMTRRGLGQMKYAPVVVFNLDVMISQTKNVRCQNGEKNGLKEGANGFPMLENHY